MLTMDTLQTDFVKFVQYSLRFRQTSTIFTTGLVKQTPDTTDFDFSSTFSVIFSEFCNHFHERGKSTFTFR